MRGWPAANLIAEQLISGRSEVLKERFVCQEKAVDGFGSGLGQR